MSISIPINEQLAIDLDEAIKYALSNKRDPKVMAQAIEDMKRTTEELRKRIGVVEIAVDLIREARDQ